MSSATALVPADQAFAYRNHLEGPSIRDTIQAQLNARSPEDQLSQLLRMIDQGSAHHELAVKIVCFFRADLVPISRSE